MPKQVPSQHQEMPKDSQKPATHLSGISSINPPAQLERRVDSSTQNHPIPQSLSVSAIAMVDRGTEKYMVTPKSRKEGVPNGEGIPHVLHECGSAYLSDHREDLISSATTTPVIFTFYDQQDHVQVACEITSSEDDLHEQ